MGGKSGIKPHGKGIQVTFYWNGERYRPTLKIPPTPTNLKYAERLKGEIEKKIAFGHYTLEQYANDFPTSRIAKSAPRARQTDTFHDAADKWVKTLSNLAQGSLRNYLKCLSFWKDAIEVGTRLDDMSYSELAALANSQGWKPKHRNNMLIPLRGIFAMATLDGQIAKDPTENIKNSKPQKPNPDPFTLEEVNKITAELMTRYDEQIYNYFEFAFFTGVRPEEQIALRWDDIDWTLETARIERVRTAGADRGWTKTAKGRDIELNSRALAALTRQKKFTFLKDPYIFHNPVTGKRWNSEHSQRRAYWTPTIKRLGMRHRRQYETRHTFATINLMAGANPMWVAQQLGHQTMQMTLSVYSKWIVGADKSREKGKIEMILGGDSHNHATKKS